MELAIDDPIKRAQQYAINPNNFQGGQAPLSNNPGLGTQMADMAKQQLMKKAVTEGTGALTGAGSSALAGSGMGTAAMTAMPYVGAGLLAGKAFGLFNEGGMVGPLSMKYYTDMYNKYFPTKDMKDMGEPPAFTDRGVVKPNIQPDTGMPTAQDMRIYGDELSNQALKDIINVRQKDASTEASSFSPRPGRVDYFKGRNIRSFDQGGEVGMTEADARALMNNQPNPDQLYDEIIMEQVGPLARPQIRDPYGADRTHSPYDMIRPDNAPNT